MRRGVLMRKKLYSGAWNADVWLHLFPMSLADRSFDSDGNCVCVNAISLHLGFQIQLWLWHTLPSFLNCLVPWNTQN